MKSKRVWIGLAIANLCMVACLGVLMRSKIIFDLPWVDYNRLVDTHGHFAFIGWVTFALIILMVYELPGALYGKKIYRFLLGLIFISAWATIATTPFESLKFVTEVISVIYIVFTYVLASVFINDIIKTSASRTVKLLSVSSLLCLVLSSAGVFMLSYLFAVKSVNAVLYRDALFGYLHMQYNGFFTLAVFSLIYNKVVSNTTEKSRKSIHRFAIFLCLSIVPSMFLTFLWSKATLLLQAVSGTGSLFLLLSLGFFMVSAPLLIKEFKMIKKEIRYMAVLSISAFVVKIFLQSMTFINSVNVLVFGNRPMIMCFLHLVFLGFVTLFLIAYFAQIGILDTKKIFTRFALAVFTTGVLINEILLMLQGIGNMLVVGSPLFNWYLLGAGILLLLGTVLIAAAGIYSSSKQSSVLQ